VTRDTDVGDSGSQNPRPSEAWTGHPFRNTPSEDSSNSFDEPTNG